jgi:hypothetical protein
MHQHNLSALLTYRYMDFLWIQLISKIVPYYGMMVLYNPEKSTLKENVYVWKTAT